MLEAECAATPRSPTEPFRPIGIAERIRNSRPNRYKVLLISNGTTPVDFIIWLLGHVFQRNDADARSITNDVLTLGVGVANVYPYDVAETKVAAASSITNQHRYSLQCRMEQE